MSVAVTIGMSAMLVRVFFCLSYDRHKANLAMFDATLGNYGF